MISIPGSLPITGTFEDTDITGNTCLAGIVVSHMFSVGRAAQPRGPSGVGRNVLFGNGNHLGWTRNVVVERRALEESIWRYGSWKADSRTGLQKEPRWVEGLG